MYITAGVPHLLPQCLFPKIHPHRRRALTKGTGAQEVINTKNTQK